VCEQLFDAKKAKKLSFEQLANELGRAEVAVAAIFYGQAKASEEDVKKLAQVLDLDEADLLDKLYSWPDRGRTVECPPKDPLIYRLWEIIQVRVADVSGCKVGCGGLTWVVAELWISVQGGDEREVWRWHYERHHLFDNGAER